jgi:tetratricopeptide (TPR) repeat protein
MMPSSTLTVRSWARTALLSLCTASCGLAQGTVTRISNGVTVEGRYVPPEAYAAYAKGAFLEARGDDAGALAEYRLALDYDSDAPEILARLGAVQCRLSTRAGDGWSHAARKSFARALAVDPQAAAAWLERARCAERGGNLEDALAFAERAALLDPSSEAAALLVIECAEKSGRLDLARTWLDALVVDEPVTRATWLRFAAFGARQRDAGRVHRARQALRALNGAEPPELLLEDSLTHGNLVGARRAAVDLRLTPGKLALRAADAGALELARAQSELVIDADPDDSDAWAAALLGSSLEHDGARFQRILADAPVEPTPPSTEAVRALTELLGRIAGPDAVAAWKQGTGF